MKIENFHFGVSGFRFSADMTLVSPGFGVSDDLAIQEGGLI